MAATLIIATTTAMGILGSFSGAGEFVLVGELLELEEVKVNPELSGDRLLELNVVL